MNYTLDALDSQAITMISRGVGTLRISEAAKRKIMAAWKPPDHMRHPLISFEGLLGLGIDVTVDPSMPIFVKSNRLRSRDRFTLFEAADADWAVAAGLAEWELDEVHAVWFDELRLQFYRSHYNFGVKLMEPRGFIRGLA